MKATISKGLGLGIIAGSVTGMAYYFLIVDYIITKNW